MYSEHSKKLLKYYNYLFPSKKKKFIDNVTGLLFKIIYFIFNIFLPRIKSKRNTDILIIGHEKNISRISKIIQLLKNNYIVATYRYQKNTDILKTLFHKTEISFHINNLFFLNYISAEYFIKKYKPKVLIHFYNRGLSPSILRAMAKFENGKTICLPHSVIGSDIFFSSSDNDYTFVFGKSSIIGLENNSHRIGETKVVEVGSPFINFSGYKATQNKKSILYFSSWKHQSSENERKRLLTLIEWAKNHLDYKLFIKLHPLEKTDYIEKLSESDNIDVLGYETDVFQALEKASIVVTHWSNASIEAALCNIPIIVLNFFKYIPESNDFRESDKYLYLERFFGYRVDNIHDLHERIQSIEMNYEYYTTKCREFVDFHLTYKNESANIIAGVIGNIINNKENNDLKCFSIL